jgi:hypothetical protein
MEFLTSLPFISKEETSALANYIQARDGWIARAWARETGMACVHDCFWIDSLNLMFLSAKVSELMRRKFSTLNLPCDTRIRKKLDNVFSLFIVL